MVSTDNAVTSDLNAELHARPSIYFSGPAFVEHVALRPKSLNGLRQENIIVVVDAASGKQMTTQVEFHTEFATVTRVTQLDHDCEHWPLQSLSAAEASRAAGLEVASIVNFCEILVLGANAPTLEDLLRQHEFSDVAASMIGAGDATVCSDFRARHGRGSRLLLINSALNSYRLGRMVRRLCEIETYRSMALLSLPEARRLVPLLQEGDRQLEVLATRNVTVESNDHKSLLDEIAALSARLISATASTRTRFGATAAYAKIVEERIVELRETHVPGFQRFGTFVTRRFRPAVRTCEATADRLEHMSITAMHLIDLLQTRIQVEVELQNVVQIKAVAERTAAQVKIQRAVEGFSIIAISYYLVGLIKAGAEAAQHAGLHFPPELVLWIMPLAIGCVALSILRARRH
ncbi:DUF3422 domain-containing protein (plasmid) [Rhizobium leguminosarum]